MVICMKKLCGLILLCGLAAGAQQQDQQPPQKSLGEIAREYRANKKPGAPVRVIDNDAFPSVGATTPAAPADTTSDTKSADGKKDDGKGGDAKDQAKVTPSEQQKWDAWKVKLDAQKRDVALLQRELDVTDREARVRAATFYADAGSQLRDPGKFAEETRKQQEEIQAKTLLLNAAKQRLADLQEQARKDGVPFSIIDN
jgi:hypothetical protein